MKLIPSGQENRVALDGEKARIKPEGSRSSSSTARWLMSGAALIHASVFAFVWTDAQGWTWPVGLRPMLLVILVGEVVAFAFSALDIRKYWFGLVLVLAVKVPGALGALAALPTGYLDARLLLFAAVFDLIWSAIIIRLTANILHPPVDQSSAMSFTEAIHGVKDQMGETLFDLSMTSPVMVVFLRHFGCTFCREALSDLQRMRADIEKHGTQLAIIHMSPDDEAEFMLGRYGLESVHRISDPFRRVYKAFDLRRGTASQLLGLQVWWRGFQAGLLKGHGLGAISGDALQLPGVFMIWKGRLVREYRHQSSSDRPNYREIAACDACPS